MAYVTTEELDTILQDYALTAGLNGILADYATASAVTTQLADYITSPALVSALSAYVTTASLNTELAGKVSSSALDTTLGGYYTKVELDAVLEGYVLSTALADILAATAVSEAQLTDTLVDYLLVSTFNSTIANYSTTASISATLSNYVTSAALATTLTGYVTNAALSTTLADYVTGAALTVTLADYVTSDALLDTLASYVTTAGLSSTLAGYTTTAALNTALDLKAPLASPALTGTPTAPTAAGGTNTTQIATTAFVVAEISAVVAGAPGLLDTLAEISAALGDDPNFATTITTSLAGKQPLDATLTAWAALSFGADQIAYATGADTFSLTSLSAFGRSLIDDADASAARTTLGLGIGVAVQAWDGDLDALAALSGTNTLYYRSGASAWSAVTIGANLSFTGGTLNTAVTPVNKAGDVFTGVLGIVAGSAAAPGLHISGDTDTGIYQSGADSLSVAAGGVAIATFNSTGLELAPTGTATAGTTQYDSQSLTFTGSIWNAGAAATRSVRFQFDAHTDTNNILRVFDPLGACLGGFGYASLTGTWPALWLTDLVIGPSYSGIKPNVAGGALIEGGLGIGTSSINSVAILDLTSTSKGLLLPRLTTTQVNAISSPPDGLTVYDTDTDTIKVRANGAWSSLAAGSAFTGGDLSSALGIVAGSEAAPGLYFVGNSNTGLRSSASNKIELVTNGADRWQIDASGNLLAADTNTYDIGASGGNKPRSLYTSSTIYGGNHVQATGAFLFSVGCNLQASGTESIVLYNNGNTSFGLLKFGGTTSSFPALKRSSAELHGRLADDSAYANIVGAILEAKTSVKFPDATTQTSAAVQDVRLGTEASVGMAGADTNYKAPTGNVLTGVRTALGDPNGIEYLYYKPLQKNIGGSWTTISG